MKTQEINTLIELGNWAAKYNEKLLFRYVVAALLTHLEMMPVSCAFLEQK